MPNEFAPAPTAAAFLTQGAGPEEIVLRASEDVWSFEEPEGEVKPGVRRPFRVIGEQSVHLSHTAHKLNHEILKNEVERIVRQLGVPVEVRLVKARWLYAFDGEERQRVVTSLAKGHRFSDFKMILGVDYLGDWATIHMNLAIEPETELAPPEAGQPPETPKWSFPVGAAVGALVLVAGMAMDLPPLTSIGGLVVAAGIFFNVLQNMNLRSSAQARWQNEAQTARRAWEAQQSKNKEERKIMRMVRSFKVDDLRLFRTAMEEVFKQVVDGIQQRGGTVVQRLEDSHNLLGTGRPTPGAAAEADI